MNLKPIIKKITLLDGEEIFIKQFTIRTKLKFSTPSVDQAEFAAKMLASSICDADGKLLYSVDELYELDAITAEHIAKEILSFNQLHVEKKDN